MKIKTKIVLSIITVLAVFLLYAAGLNFRVSQKEEEYGDFRKDDPESMIGVVKAYDDYWLLKRNVLVDVYFGLNGRSERLKEKKLTLYNISKGVNIPLNEKIFILTKHGYKKINPLYLNEELLSDNNNGMDLRFEPQFAGDEILNLENYKFTDCLYLNEKGKYTLLVNDIDSNGRFTKLPSVWFIGRYDKNSERVFIEKYQHYQNENLKTDFLKCD